MKTWRAESGFAAGVPQLRLPSDYYADESLHDEEHLLIGCQRPQIVGYHAFKRVAGLAHRCHRGDDLMAQMRRVFELGLTRGMGDKFDKSSGSLLKAGGFVCMPKDVHHYAWAQGPTTIQVHGLAPFAFTYVNPSDDPRNKH